MIRPNPLGMSRADVLARLLQHGRLSIREAREITGWTPLNVTQAMYWLRKRREVRRVHIDRAAVYQLTDLARVPRLYD